MSDKKGIDEIRLDELVSLPLLTSATAPCVALPPASMQSSPTSGGGIAPLAPPGGEGVSYPNSSTATR
jgi:hypothetical protein